MRLIRIGIGAVNSTVGAVRSNGDRVVEQARAMAEDDVTLACFPEQAVGGYPHEDLVQWEGFVSAQSRELERIAERTADLPTVLVVGLAVGVDGQLFNAAAVVHGGRIVGMVPKEKLPTYDVFYEARTLSRGGPGLSLDADGVPLGDYLFEFDFGTVAVEVCEDLWTPSGPARRRCLSGAEVVVNVSASPYRVGVLSTRREMLATRSADNQCTLAYACKVGAQDGLVFDGGGFVVQNGRPCLEAPRFEEGTWSSVVDLDRTRRLRRENTTWRHEREAFQREEEPVPALRSDARTADRDDLPYPGPDGDSFFLPAARGAGETPDRSDRQRVLDDLFDALALGVADYFRKTGAFRCMGVALSGGRDSTLTLLVAWSARERLRERGVGEEPLLRAFYMPSRYSGDDTRRAAGEIARELEVPLATVSIDDALERELEATRAMLGGEEPTEVTVENIQARLRGTRMWNWANSADGLFLQTGDMSEKAVGYTTIGGDLEGALSVIANLPKTVVIALLRRLRDRFGFEGIEATLDTRAGPELAEDQAAVEDLMPFPVLDACLHLYAEEKLTEEQVAAVLPDLFPDRDPEQLERWAGRFAGMFTQSIFKWVQAPLSLHVGRLDLERERALQLPVVQGREWGGPGD